MWRLKGISGISEGIAAEFEGADGKIEAGKGAQGNTKIAGAEFPGRSTCSPGKGTAATVCMTGTAQRSGEKAGTKGSD